MSEIKQDTIRDLLNIKGMTKEMLKAVLTHPNIAVVNRDAELPDFGTSDNFGRTVAFLTQQDILKAGYVKEEK